MWIEVDGARLHLEVRGEGAPVLLIHGFPHSGELWHPTALRLEHECRLILPDLRGHGQSEAAGEVSMRRYASDVVEMLDAAGETGPVVVGGLSMGGYVALEICRSHPERVRSLVLVDSRAGADSPDAAEARRALARRVLREGSGVVADSLADRLFAPSAPAELRSRWREIMAATPPRGVAAALLAMAARSDSSETLRTLARPLLVVVGAEDAITPPSEARLMQQAVPGARLEVVPAAGHMTPVEQPDRFAEILREFVLAG